MIAVSKDEIFEHYITDPETMDAYCEHCMINHNCLNKIRKEFEKYVRATLKENFPDRKIEGKIIDNETGRKIDCWYFDNEKIIESKMS